MNEFLESRAYVGNMEIPVDECESMMKWLLTPNGWLGYKCAKMGREVEGGDGYTIHFHTAGRLRPWKKSITIVSDMSGVGIVLTWDQCLYVLAHHPDTWTIAAHWLKEVFGATVSGMMLEI